MLVVDKENGLYGVLHVEFLPRKFQVSCNVSYFAYVSLIENFPQNSPSIIWSSMHLSSIDHLVYRELPSLYNLVING